MAQLPKSKGIKPKTKAATKASGEDDDIKSSFDERDAVSDQLDDDVGFDDDDDLGSDMDGAESDDFFKDVTYTGRVDVDGKAEANALLKGFKERAKREAERMASAVDDEYWVGVIFQTRKQKEEWLAALMKRGVSFDGDRYVDGLLVARAQGIPLTQAPPPQTKFRTAGKFTDLALPIKKNA